MSTAVEAPTLRRRVLDVLPRGGSLSEREWEVRHRGIVVLAWLHAVVTAVLTVVTGHSLWAALTSGALVAAFAAAATLPGRSRTWRASAATLALFTSTALLIHVFHGLIELHFHFFVIVAVVAMYQMWTPYLIGLLFVLAHHAVMGVLMPMAVYNHPAAIHHPVLFAAIHASFVLAESVACLTYWKVTERAVEREREQRERAEAVNEALTVANREIADLLAMMSHDLRAPLSVINGAATLALESWPELDDDSRHTFMSKVNVAGLSLQEMLEETLTMSALDADGAACTPTPVPLDQAVRSLLETLDQPLHDVDLTDLDPVTALVDQTHLAQVVSNLVSNAVKYGAAPFAVRTRQDGDTVVLEVEDRGPGVDPAFVPRLFDRYARADDARLGPQRGTGLGLYIVRGLVEVNAGTVHHESPDEGGTRFVVRLPACPRLVAVEPVDPRSVVPSVAAG